MMTVGPVAPISDTGRTRQQIDSTANALAFSLFAVMPDGSCTFIQTNRLITSSFTLRGTTLTTGSGTFHNVVPTSYGLSLNVPVPGETGAALRCEGYRIGFGHDERRVLALANAVFTHPTGPETDEQLRRRVKNCLAFYALYFKAIYANRLNRFKPGAIAMPIRYYSGALRLANYDQSAPWAGLYATANDAKRAHRLFRRAIKSVRNYPERGNILLEYALIFDEMSRSL